MTHQGTLEFDTTVRGALEITGRVASLVHASGIRTGLCQLFLHHTSASLMICENADPQVLRDLEVFMARLVPDGDAIFRHRDEGPDDMPAHVRTILTQVSLAIPITAGRLALGVWQGIYLWEHRVRAHTRRLTVTLNGDAV